jgi:NADH-quinone oxidoreductase subunit G
MPEKVYTEFLLINHPLDCPVCDQAGECKLQDLSYEHGLAKSRYEFKRREFERKDIGDKIQLHMNRCILCYRCTQVAEQLDTRKSARRSQQRRSFRNFYLYRASGR